jgi:2-phospho-L-lactate guanylyltransferase
MRASASSMMWAVVPLKSPQRAKSRLADVLNPAQRRHLLFDLATRVIGALQAARGIDAVAVVTASAEVAAFARALGAEIILQPDEAGTASAFAQAVLTLQTREPSRLLMIAGDLPLISPAAVQRLIDTNSTATPGVVIVPDRHRSGTNALLCSPPAAIEPCFGSDSFRRHLAAANAAGIAAQTLQIDELALDLDCADDLDVLRRHGGAYTTVLFETLRSMDTEAPPRVARRAA